MDALLHGGGGLDRGGGLHGVGGLDRGGRFVNSTGDASRDGVDGNGRGGSAEPGGEDCDSHPFLCPDKSSALATEDDLICYAGVQRSRPVRIFCPTYFTDEGQTESVSFFPWGSVEDGLVAEIGVQGFNHNPIGFVTDGNGNERRAVLLVEQESHRTKQHNAEEYKTHCA